MILGLVPGQYLLEKQTEQEINEVSRFTSARGGQFYRRAQFHKSIRTKRKRIELDSQYVGCQISELPPAVDSMN